MPNDRNKRLIVNSKGLDYTSTSMKEIELWKSYQDLHQKHPRSDSESKVNFYNQNSEFIKRSAKINFPDLTIIVPAYNEANFLPRTLAGINLALSSDENRNTSLIVVNNASDDDTKDVALAFGAQVIDEPKKGIGRARQTGLESTKNSVKHILTTDADTLVTHNWIEGHRRYLEFENTVFTYGNIKFIADTKLNLHEQCLLFFYTQSANLVHTIKNKMGIYIAGAANAGFNRELAMLIGGYNIKLSKGEDTDLMHRLAKHGSAIKNPDNMVITSARRILGRGILTHGLSRLKENINHSFTGEVSVSEKYDDYRIN